MNDLNFIRSAMFLPPQFTDTPNRRYPGDVVLADVQSRFLHEHYLSECIESSDNMGSNGLSATTTDHSMLSNCMEHVTNDRIINIRFEIRGDNEEVVFSSSIHPLLNLSLLSETNEPFHL